MITTEMSRDRTAASWVSALHTVLNSEDQAWTMGILGVAFLCYCCFLLTSSRAVPAVPKLPPGPRNLPLVGALFSMERKNKAQSFTRLARRYGPIVYFRLGSRDVVVVSSVEGAEEVLKTQDAAFANRPNTTIMRSSAKYMGFEAQDILHSDYNSNLRALRKLCLAEFFTGPKLAGYEHIRRHEGAVMVERIGRQVDNEGSGAKINVRESLSFMATRIMAILIVGRLNPEGTVRPDTKPGPADFAKNFVRDLPAILRRFKELFLGDNLGDLVPWLSSVDLKGLDREYKHFQQVTRKYYGEIIEEHRYLRRTVKNFEDQDFLDFLLTLQESGKITGDAVLGCINNMVIGGIDTSSISTEWALLELVRNPEVMARLQEELDTVVGKDRQVEESDYTELPYLEAVVRETFRLHAISPVLTPHSNLSPTTLGGFYIPANTAVFVNTYATARDPALWENPEKFDPERFMGHSHSLDITGGSYRLLPFGSGRRMCVGYKLGLIMFRRMLTTLVHAYDWSPPPPLEIRDLSVAEGSEFISSPLEPLVLSAAPRLASTVYRA